MTLIVASVGFIAKLFAEAIEEISLKQVEAVRATGAGLHEHPDHGRPAAGAPTLHRLCHVPARLKSPQFHNGRHRRRWRHRRRPVHRYQRFDFDVVLAILIIIVSLIMPRRGHIGLGERVFQ